MTRDASPNTLKVLALLGDRAQPPINGSRVRNFHLWPAIQSRVGELKILSLDQSRNDVDAPLGPPGCNVRFFVPPRQSLPIRAFNALRYSYHQWPRSSELAAAVDE